MDTQRQTGSGVSAPRVLIVEDHPMIAELVETRLRIEGMRATKCLGGREAMEILAGADFDLVILDIMMPEVDGYEVLKYLKSHDRTRQVPVILLTAKSTQDDVEKGLGLGADYYITKPFSGAELVRKVKVLLEQRGLDRAAGA
jgi:DNA-binding response OmpR family regulator